MHILYILPYIKDTQDIEVLAMDISYPISKIFDIEGFYNILNLFNNDVGARCPYNTQFY